MRYFAETVDSIKSVWIRDMFPLRHVQIIKDDLLSFEYDSLKDSYSMAEFAGNKDIARVYLDDTFLRYKVNSNLSKLENNLRLMWYGRCDEVAHEHGTSVDLTEHRSKLNSVWKPQPDTQSFVSWSSRIHESVPQPFSSIKEGNLYLFDSSVSHQFTLPGLADTNVSENLGISQCNHTTNSISSVLDREYNLIWYGVCDTGGDLYCNLQSYSEIKEVYQFSKNGSAFSGVYLSDDLTKSTITKLEFGNGYLVRIDKDIKNLEIPNCAVSNHVVLNTFAPVHPLRLSACSVSDATPTPTIIEPTPTPLDSLCCGDRVYTRLINGVANDVNTISLVGSPNGILCWDEIIETSSGISQYSVSLGGSNYEDGGLSISTSGVAGGKTFKFETELGVCYQGTLANELGINIFSIVDDQPNITPTPTPVLVPTPTPQTITSCCDGMELSILITKEMAESTNPTGPAGISISGFQEGGLICMSGLDNINERLSCMLFTEDETIGGLITLSFQPRSNIIRYKAPSGKCYEGTLKNTTTEHQILTEV